MSLRVALGLFGLALVTRLPFATVNLYAHDSVLYARGMERFDPLDQRPQPPGYLWYILLLRAVDLFTHDPNRAMTLVSAVAGGATVVLAYILAARLYDERTGRISALFVMSAVTFWAYGGVAYPYTVLAALTTACALLFWRALDQDADRPRRGAHLVAASAAWGVAAGFRSDLAIFLAPLWLLAATQATVLTAAAAALAVAIPVVVWIGASALADGGLARFLEAVRVQSKFVDDRYSVFGNGPIAIYRNSYELARFLGRGLYFLIPVIGAVFVSADARRAELRDRLRVAFLLLWTLAPLPFYVFVHVGEYGYVFSMLPGLAVIAARGAVALAKGIRYPRALPWIVGFVVLANASVFLLSDLPISARDLARHDRGLDEKAEYIRAQFVPATTVIVTGYDALLVRERLDRTYPMLAYDPAELPSFTRPLVCDAALTPPCSGGEVDVVLWDDVLRTMGVGWEERRMPHGARLRVQHAPRSATLRVSDGLGVELLR